ncbi:hypothetical protein AArcMg_1786 [Natrarchaeobaculum sulfurireducens]|uniref:DNA primase/polymerase bifunctional N-terminal domain-containing protein n=2 Tax=Natrarchaeobaculum sulfurireducens TaxID=2044521 RepID=A0A346PQJ9_9EURY|nr:hypothetical protein AArcMg_1786 [Natrarchaeobaculum sulfurireducens]
MYEEACRRAGRETWEPVEQSVLLDILGEVGMAELVTDGVLADLGDWTQMELPNCDPAWYCRSGLEPRPREFREFHELLVENAPAGYEPYYFRVRAASKAPAIEYGSWKSEENRLSFQEALDWMRSGGNVGIAGTPDDPLVNVDIDDDEETAPEDIPSTLRARSRSRTGFHAWYFAEDEIPNIPTDTAGEIRTDWQYVVAPGSFVASFASELPDEADSPGYYTVEETSPVARIEYEDLPAVFREFHEEMEDEAESGEERADAAETEVEPPEPAEGRKSAVYDVEMQDVLRSVGGGSTQESDRWSAIWHSSDTSSNMSYSDGKLHCWRHNVAHGPLQALAVLCDESGGGDSACRQIGTGHRSSGAGGCSLRGDWRLSWYAWLEAKRRGLIPEDDAVPYTVIDGLATERGLMKYPEEHDRDTLPAATYNAVLYLIEDEYDVDPGRDPVGRDRDKKKGEAKAAKETAEGEDEEIVASLMDDML